jgi:hypothetical protein
VHGIVIGRFFHQTGRDEAFQPRAQNIRRDP